MERPITRRIVFAAFLITMWVLVENSDLTAAQESQKTGPILRECKPGYDSSGTKKKTRKSYKEDLPMAPSCIDVKEQGLFVQENLQKVVRGLRWNIGDEQISEDLWTFSMYLGAQDTVAYTRPPSDPKVTWSGGKALVNLRTTELQDGFTRIIATVKFDGYGESGDQFAPQRKSWPLPSNGTLEAKIVEAVKSHFAPAH